MLKRVVLVLLALILVGGVLVPAQLAAEPTPDATDQDLKGARPQDDPESSVPASSEWSMLIMVMLVLSASTAMLAGGGFFQRRMKFEFVMPTPADPEPSKTPEPAAESGISRPHKAPKSSPKRKLSHSRRQEWQQKGKNFTGRNAITRRKSGGPGCRGVR